MWVHPLIPNNNVKHFWKINPILNQIFKSDLQISRYDLKKTFYDIWYSSNRYTYIENGQRWAN